MYKYVGKAFITGVPARDLTDEEAKQYGVKLILKSGLYVKESEKPKPAENKLEKRYKEKKTP